jgi:hypothetical protein
MRKTVLLSLFTLLYGVTQLLSRAQVPSGIGEGPDVPQEQKEFCSIVTQYRELETRYSQETNPIRKAGMTQPNPLRYEERVKELFSPDNEFRNGLERSASR